MGSLCHTALEEHLLKSPAQPGEYLRLTKMPYMCPNKCVNTFKTIHLYNRHACGVDQIVIAKPQESHGSMQDVELRRKQEVLVQEAIRRSDEVVQAAIVESQQRLEKLRMESLRLEVMLETENKKREQKLREENKASLALLVDENKAKE